MICRCSTSLQSPGLAAAGPSRSRNFSGSASSSRRTLDDDQRPPVRLFDPAHRGNGLTRRATASSKLLYDRTRTSIKQEPVQRSRCRSEGIQGRHQEGLLRCAPQSFGRSDSLQLAKKYHPDTNKEAGSKARFQEIQDAFDVRPICIHRVHARRPWAMRRSASSLTSSDQHLSNLASIRTPTLELSKASAQAASISTTFSLVKRAAQGMRVTSSSHYSAASREDEAERLR